VTTPLEAREAVLLRWVDEWVDDNGEERTITVFDNEGLATISDEVTAYAYVQIRELDSDQLTFGPPGGRMFRRRDLVYIEIGTPSNAGRGDTDAGAAGDSTLGQLARAVYEGVRFDNVVGLAGRVRPGDVRGRWAITSIEIPITYNEIK